MTALTVTAPTTGPYGDHAHAYLRAGWAPLPLPARAKKHPPEGWTGARGAWPSGADVHAWTEERPGGNIALRLPPNVIGIDVDNYDGKIGGLVLTDLETSLGPLPVTWRSTSRDDGISGIRFYIIPEGLRWPGELGPGIEVIRHGHRYAVAWPSIHPDTGNTYKWINPAGHITIGEIPAPETLPALPPAWIERFTGGEAATEQARAGLDTAAAHAWLQQRDTPGPCRVTERALGALLDSLTTAGAGSRHEAALTGTNRLLWIAGLGHTGVPTALHTARAAFLTATAADRGPGEARAEWDRLIDGGINLAAAAHPHMSGADPCTDPFHGLIGPTTPTANATATTTTGNGSTPTTAPTSTTNTSDASAADSSTPSPSTPDAEPLEDARTTWWPRDHDLITNAEPEPGPAYLLRDDGHALFYPGRVNGIVAPSESGKTWVALLAAVQAVEAGERVTILDFEDSHSGIHGRLTALGLTPTQIRDHIAYIGPDEPFHPFLPTGRDLTEHLDTWQPSLIILDGFNAAMTLQGLDLMSNKDATTFAQTVLKPLARAGAAVVYIDHTPKDTEKQSAGGIGAQAKRAMTTGCALKVEVIKPFGKGQEGKLRLRVDKDRQGDVRGISLPGKSGHWAADVTIAPAQLEDGGDGVQVIAHAPAGSSDTAPTEREAFRPTGLMDKVSAFLADSPGAGVREIKEARLGRNEYVVKALESLVSEGWVRVEQGANRKMEHRNVERFNELIQPPAERPAECGPECGPSVAPGHGQTGVAHVAPSPGRSPGGTGHTGRSDGTTATTTKPGAHSRVVERVIAGERVKFDLVTGAIVEEASAP